MAGRAAAAPPPPPPGSRGPPHQTWPSGLKNKNIGILITDHNVQETLAITDKTYLMFEGKILKAGTPEELVEDEMVRRVYLGQNFELRKKKLEF